MSVAPFSGPPCKLYNILYIPTYSVWPQQYKLMGVVSSQIHICIYAKKQLKDKLRNSPHVNK